jgi:pimeloyl-ACP methyl ester carboxylesterase
VISFRGSISLRNFLADVIYDKAETDLCDGCTAHRGFWTAWTEARDAVLSALISTAEKHRDYKMVVTGHSLGGAVATFCAAEVRKRGWGAALVSFSRLPSLFFYGVAKSLLQPFDDIVSADEFLIKTSIRMGRRELGTQKRPSSLPTSPAATTASRTSTTWSPGYLP